MPELPTNDQKISEGDFMRLFVKHEPVLRAYARSILPDWTSVDDALQEASVTMWEKLGQLRAEDGFLPWAKVIVRFKCLSAVDAIRRNRLVLSESVLDLVADEAESLTVTDYANVRRSLSSCLDQFSSLHQELLLAPYSGDGHVKKMAERGRKSVNALYKLLGRLRARLADCVRLQLSTESSA